LPKILCDSFTVPVNGALRVLDCGDKINVTDSLSEKKLDLLQAHNLQSQAGLFGSVVTLKITPQAIN